MIMLRAVPLVQGTDPLGVSLRGVIEVAGENADDVDQGGRFPSEAISALRKTNAFSWYVPRKFDGAELDIEELAKATFELARRCSATSMIFAMHQIQVASLVHHAADTGEMSGYLMRLSAEQRLIASVTSEVGVGGDLRKSIACLEACDSHVSFEKKASAISYGAYADDLLITLRRSAAADCGDQVLLLAHSSDVELWQTGEWDALGMRGTCSPAFTVRGICPSEQMLRTPFCTIASETMVPVSHILWAHVWLGIATDAFDRAQKFVRTLARQTPGVTPPPANHLVDLSISLVQFRALVNEVTREYAANLKQEDRTNLSSIGFALRINNLKIAASNAVVEICQGALRVCGFAGYKNGGPYSVGRHLRDAHSAALMIANDRLAATNAALLLMHRSNE
jgi:acyl-CoA dehydrogenase